MFCPSLFNILSVLGNSLYSYSSLQWINDNLVLGYQGLSPDDLTLFV